ncbi:MAG: hypothetical protein RLZ51_364, partial [Pseudomonadota bacterium]
MRVLLQRPAHMLRNERIRIVGTAAQGCNHF